MRGQFHVFDFASRTLCCRYIISDHTRGKQEAFMAVRDRQKSPEQKGYVRVLPIIPSQKSYANRSSAVQKNDLRVSEWVSQPASQITRSTEVSKAYIEDLAPLPRVLVLRRRSLLDSRFDFMSRCLSVISPCHFTFRCNAEVCFVKSPSGIFSGYPANSWSCSGEESCFRYSCLIRI